MGGNPISGPGGRVSLLGPGGVPHPADRGTPSQVQVGGTPHLDLGWSPSPPRPRLDRVPPVQNWMGYPPSKTGWGTPIPSIQDCMGYTPLLARTGWGTPPPPTSIRRQSSIASTCYMAGGMPLAFTQEDFLVCFIFRENLIRVAFQSLQLVVTDFLPIMPSPCLQICVEVAGRFGLQNQELNISLTAIGLLVRIILCENFILSDWLLYNLR